MNERIKELAAQAGLESVDFPYDEFGMSYEQLKFAKLIVEECASICYKSDLADSDIHALNLLYEFNIDNARNQK